MPFVDLQGFRPRLEASAAAVAEAHSAWKLKLRHRNAIVTEAVDAGMSHRQAAKAAGIKSLGTLTAILAGSQPDDEPA